MRDYICLFSVQSGKMKWKNRVTLMENEAKSKEKEVEDLKRDLAASRARITQMENQAKSNLEEVDILKTRLIMQQAEKEPLLAKLEGDVKLKCAEIEILKVTHEKERLEWRMSLTPDMTPNSNQNTIELESAKKARGEAELKWTSQLESEIKNKSKEIENLQKQLTETVDAWKRYSDDLNNKLEESRSEANKYKEELAAAKAQIAQMESEIQPKSTEINSMYEVESIADEEIEEMITKRKTEGGGQASHRLKEMLKDKESWGTLNANFKEYCVANPIAVTVDVGVRVLTAGIWPTSASAAPLCVLPDECQTAFEHFRQYYTGAHKGRMINLNTRLGWAEIKATFYGSTPREPTPKRKENHKILVVNTHAMILLMRFNIRPKFTLEQLQKDTQLWERDLLRCLQSLSMGEPTQRILVRKGKGNEMDYDDEFTVNDEFTSKLTRIRTQNIESKMEEERARNDWIYKDRKRVAEDAIWRIMKRRKTLQHNDLAVAVTEQLSYRFKPGPMLIKLCIESLIEREYIKRSDDNHRVYHYIE